MYIRRTKIKSRKDGSSYFTYRLVESIRTQNGVRQQTILNLGRHFPYPRDLWPEIAIRISDIMRGQKSLFELPEEVEKASQYYAGQIINARGQPNENQKDGSTEYDWQNVDINSIDLIRPRSVGVEHAAYETLKKLGIDKKFEELGLNSHQKNTAIGIIIARVCEPGSELSTHRWLRENSGLGELINYDFEETSLIRMYRASDILLKHKEELESFVYGEQKSLFQFEETITLYDLTNTYFEGTCKFNELGVRARSKEKRSDCPLVTPALVLDTSGFPKRSEIFKGNVSEPGTLKKMIGDLEKKSRCNNREDSQYMLFGKTKPLIVMDAGIATEDNIEWLKSQKYQYLVVSRKRHREFSEDNSVTVKEERDYKIRVCRVNNEKTGETELYCHSTRKENKENSIINRFESRFGEELKKLDKGLTKKGCTKKYDKVMEKIGRLKQKYSKAAKNYVVNVQKHEDGENAKKVTWQVKKRQNSQDSHPGVYCLRTNWKVEDEKTLWRTYTMLTDLESVFRSLKSELGLRPVYHQKAERVAGHLFITVLSYHIVHNIRIRLKKNGINASWERLREEIQSQCRVTTGMRMKDGRMLHVRKATKPETRQKTVADALGISCNPGGTVKTIV